MFAMLIIMAVFIPVLSGVGLRWLKTDRKTLGKLSVAFIAVSAFCALMTLICVEAPSFTLFTITGKVKIRFALDGMSRFYLVLVSLVWLGVGVYATEYVEHDNEALHFYRYYLITYGALVGLSASANLITLYMFYELMTLLTVPLVAHAKTRESTAAAVKYLIYSVFGASMALLGIFFVGAYAGSFEFSAGGVFTAETLNEHASLLRVIFFLMILGFGVKAGMFPTHAWLPTAHPVAPAPASAVLSGVITKMGVLGIIRTIFYIAGADFIRGTWVQYTFMALSLITVVMGSTLALKEKVFKKRLAYSTVSQVSYVLFGISTMTVTGFVGACLHILFHSLIKNTLFMSAGAVIHKTGITQVRALKGIGRRMPYTMTCFTVVALGLIGIPPTGGFISKWNLAQGALETGICGSWIGPACLLLSAVLTAAYLLSISIDAFFDGSKAAPESSEVSLRMVIPMGVFACAAVLLGIIPGGLISFFTAIAESII